MQKLVSRQAVQFSGDPATIRWDERGLVPVVVQDRASGQVLMLAYANAEALQRTLETGEAHFWSRSRQSLWHKGATSGHVQRVVALGPDCDADTLLMVVEPAGPACHTGSFSCFTMAETAGAAPGGALPALLATLDDRRAHPREGSYTNRLLDAGEDEIVKKIGEEAVEVILAAKGQGDARLVSEAGDLLYHLAVLLVSRGLGWAAIEEELARRARPGAAPRGMA